MFSIGIDTIEINRIKKSMNRKGFLNRILGNEEFEQLNIKNFPAQSVAGNFCAKEAFSKAVGTGFRGFYMKEVEIIKNEIGKPFIKLTGKAFELYGKFSFSVSITHTKNLASAVVLFSKGDKIYG